MFFFFFVRRVFAIIRSPFALGWWHQDGGIRVGWWRWCGGCDGKEQDARAFFCCAVDGLPAAPARRGAGHEARRPRGSRRGSWRVSLVRACSFVSAGIPFARLSICSRRRPHSSYSSTPVHTRPHPSTPVHTRPHPSTPVHTRPHPSTPVHTRPHSSALAPYSSHARLLWLGLPEPTSRNTRGAHIDMAICHAGRDGQVWGASAGSSPIHFRHLPDRMGPRVCP